jgi:hypothetical protein
VKMRILRGGRWLYNAALGDAAMTLLQRLEDEVQRLKDAVEASSAGLARRDKRLVLYRSLSVWK